MNKTLIASALLLTTSAAYGMQISDTARKHIAKLHAAYPKLSPIAKTDPEGTLQAWHFPNGITRGLVAWSNGTYERPFIYKDEQVEIHNKDFSKDDYEKFLKDWKTYVSKKFCIGLPLDQEITDQNNLSEKTS
jgi:hypothetical protein